MALPAIETCDATDLVRCLEAGTLSPVEAVEDALRRIDTSNAALGAFATVDPDGARRAAGDAARRRAAGRPLSRIDGLPVSIKDLTDMQGVPTRKGSRITSDAPATTDAPLTAHLRAAGAVIIGKTATPEFGWKGVTDNPLSGICRNPWDSALTPGGSSGGAAVAAVLGMGWLHQGSDAGGSIRIPCAFCGLAGLKPTFGRVPQWPPSAMGPLSHLGPMARSIRDCALMMQVISRPDIRDPTLSPPDASDWTDMQSAGVAGRRIAVWREAGEVPLHPEIDAALSCAAAALKTAGAEVIEASPDTRDARAIFDVLWQAGAASIVARVPRAEREWMDPGLLAEAEMGSALDAVAHVEAEQARLAFASRMAAFQADHDFILSPAVPIPAFAAGHDVPRGTSLRKWPDWTPFTYPFNLTQQPVASVPWGTTRDGRHVGLQIAGRRHADREVLAAAAVMEAAAPQKTWPEREGTAHAEGRP